MQLRSFVEILFGAPLWRKEGVILLVGRLFVPQRINFKSLHVLNQAYMVKLSWGVGCDSDSLWARVLRAKYKVRFGSRIPPSFKAQDSPTWKGICRMWPIVVQGSRWLIGDDFSTLFWKDAWIPFEGNLMEWLPANQMSWYADLPVSFFVRDGCWKWEVLRDLLPAPICDKIVGLNPPSQARGDDRRIWDLSPNAKFCLKSVYPLLLAGLQDPPVQDF